jgi:4-alpha-glucanotransferase
MRVVFGIISLLVVLLVVGGLVKKQMAVQIAPMPSLQNHPANSSDSPASPASAASVNSSISPTSLVSQREQAQQIQQQIKQQMEALQAPRPALEDAK